MVLPVHKVAITGTVEANSKVITIPRAVELLAPVQRLTLSLKKKLAGVQKSLLKEQVSV